MTPPKKKQLPKRDISVRGSTYKRLKEHCDALEMPCTVLIEEAIHEHLDLLGVPRTAPELDDPPGAPSEPAPTSPTVAALIRAHFTY